MSGTSQDFRPAFDALDANRDSRLGHDEVAASTTLAAHFAEYDRDGGGTLTRAEYDDHVALDAGSDVE